MRIFSIAALIILLTGVVSYFSNLPQAIGLDVPDGKLNSLSYAPFREGQSPLLAIFPTPEQMEEDLMLLSEKTHTFRTYSSTEGMDVVPPIAKKYGLQMIQGIWIGYLDQGNQKEIDALVKAANAYPDVIKRVIVGNEVLLRGERTPQELVEYIRQVKSRIKQPVSYADVWSMYMKHPDLIKEVDFITIHILPYWEDEPIAVENAPAHIERIYQQVRQEADRIAPGKPILIGESGWPSAGKQRGWAKPSVVNEAKFIRGLLKVAAANHFDVNIVEAFNQPWKNELEGIIGANWGLFSADREEVFPLTGSVIENSGWFDEFVLAALILLIVVFFSTKCLRGLPDRHVTGYLFFAQLLILLLVFYADKSWQTSYDDWQRLKAVLVIIFNSALTVLVLQRACNLLKGIKSSKFLIVGLDGLYILFIVYAFYKTYLLAVDGRYVSFPFEASVIPITGLLGLFGLSGLLRGFSFSNLAYNGLTGRSPVARQRNQQIAGLLLLYMMGLIIGEIKSFMTGRDFILEHPAVLDRLGWATTYTVTNTQLVVWLASLAILALSLIAKGEGSKQ